MIGAKRVADMERVLPNLRQKLIIHGAGHWIQQERAGEVNAALIAFLKGNAATAPAQYSPRPASNSLGPRGSIGA